MSRNKIIFGKGKIPKANEFKKGQLVINLDDGTLFTKDKKNRVFEIASTEFAQAAATSSVSASIENIVSSSNIFLNITSSGNITASNLSIDGFPDLSASIAALSVGGADNLGNHIATQDLDMAGFSISASLNITASGDISSSGIIKGERFQYGDNDTFIDFNDAFSGTDNSIRLVANGTKVLDLKNDTVSVNPLNSNIDFEVRGAVNTSLLVADAGLGNVGVGIIDHASGQNLLPEKLTVEGSISASGDVKVHGAVSSSTYRHNEGNIDINSNSSRIAFGNNKIDFRTFGENFDRLGTRMSLTRTELRIGSHSNDIFDAFDEASPVDVIVTGSINTSGSLTIRVAEGINFNPAGIGAESIALRYKFGEDSDNDSKRIVFQKSSGGNYNTLFMQDSVEYMKFNHSGNTRRVLFNNNSFATRQVDFEVDDLIGSPLLFASASGKVGIGTSTLSEKLTVSGSISASGLLFASASLPEHSDGIVAVVYDTGSGRFYYTGSYGSGGGSGETIPEAFISGAINIATGSAFVSASAPDTNKLVFTKGDNTTHEIIATASLSQELTTALNEDVGTLSAASPTTFGVGSSIEALLRQMLIDFIAPTLNSFTITNLDSRMEVGDDLTVTAGTFSTSSNSDTAFASLGLTLSNNFNNTISNFEATSGTALDFDDRIVSQSVAKQITFTLTGTDSQGNTPTRTDSISIVNPIFYGGSSNTGASLSVSVLNTIIGDISGSVTSTTGTSQIVVFNSDTGTFGTQTYLNTTGTTNLPTNTKIKLPSSVANASNFTYIIYPSSYGELATVLKNDVQDETGTFTLLGAINHTRYTHAIEYNVYRSAGQNAFADGDVLTLND